MKNSVLIFISICLAMPLLGADEIIRRQAEMNITLEGSDIYVETLIPAKLILGFDHMPAEDSEKKKLQTYLSSLEKKNYISFNASKSFSCSLIDSIGDYQASTYVTLDNINEAEEILDAVGGGGQQDEEDDDEPEHPADSEDQYGLDDADDDKPYARDVYEVYTLHEYRCLSEAKVKDIEVNIFNSFPQLELVNVNVIDNGESFKSTVRKGQKKLTN